MERSLQGSFPKLGSVGCSFTSQFKVHGCPNLKVGTPSSLPYFPAMEGKPMISRRTAGVRLEISGWRGKG